MLRTLGSMHVERTFTVPRPVDTVFDYLSDFTSTNEWDPGTVQTTRTSGDGGVGTVYANTSEFMGKRTELTYETIEFSRPTRVVFQGRNKQATTHDRMTFTPTGDGTEVHYRADFEFTFPLNLLAPLVLRGKLEKLADETMEQLERKLLEQG